MKNQDEGKLSNLIMQVYVYQLQEIFLSTKNDMNN